MEEIKEYCHYILSLCNHDIISTAAIGKYKTKQDILDGFENHFDYRSNQWPKFNRRLVKDLFWSISENIYIKDSALDIDAKRIFRRCLSGAKEMNIRLKDGYDVDYDELFNIFADYIWLLASKQYCIQHKENAFYLIDNFTLLRTRTKCFLNEVYCQCEQEIVECTIMEEALRLRRKLCSYSSDERVRCYVSDYMTNTDLQNLIDEKKVSIEQKQYLFFALMVTNIRCDEMRRGLLL
jgi:hypothetical protein